MFLSCNRSKSTQETYNFFERIKLQEADLKDTFLSNVLEQTLPKKYNNSFDFYVINFYQSSFENDECYISIDNYSKKDDLSIFKYYIEIKNYILFLNTSTPSELVLEKSNFNTFSVPNIEYCEGGGLSYLIFYKYHSYYEIIKNYVEE